MAFGNKDDKNSTTVSNTPQAELQEELQVESKATNNVAKKKLTLDEKITAMTTEVADNKDKIDYASNPDDKVKAQKEYQKSLDKLHALKRMQLEKEIKDELALIRMTQKERAHGMIMLFADLLVKAKTDDNLKKTIVDSMTNPIPPKANKNADAESIAKAKVNKSTLYKKLAIYCKNQWETKD